jgi:hypothetical protein
MNATRLQRELRVNSHRNKFIISSCCTGCRYVGKGFREGKRQMSKAQDRVLGVVTVLGIAALGAAYLINGADWGKDPKAVVYSHCLPLGTEPHLGVGVARPGSAYAAYTPKPGEPCLHTLNDVERWQVDAPQYRKAQEAKRRQVETAKQQTADEAHALVDRWIGKRSE